MNKSTNTCIKTGRPIVTQLCARCACESAREQEGRDGGADQW